MSSPLDTFDQKILELMQRNCRLAADVIAEQVGLSASAVQRRIKKLREEGVIKAEVAIVDAAVTSHNMTFLAGVEIDRDNYAVLSRFKRWAEGQNTVQQVFYVTGHVDLMLVITAPDTRAYDAFIEQLMQLYPQIKRVTTNVVLDTPKKSLYVPVCDEDISA